MKIEWKSGARIVLGLAVLCTWGGGTAHGQTADQFGIRSRTDAARDMIVLAVQQGISSLPPTSGQSFVWEYAPDIGTFKRSEYLGPTSFRAAETIGAGNISLRMAGSYFDLDDSFGPVPYEGFDNNNDSFGFTRFGLDVSAQVGLFNLGGSYGITDRIELVLNVPVVVVDAKASHRFLTQVAELGRPLENTNVYGARTNAEIDGLLRCNEPDCLRYRTETVDAFSKSLQAHKPNPLPPLDFNSGTNAGVGRISFGGKAAVYSNERLNLSLMGEFFAQSPHEDRFAGSATWAFLPRVITSLKLTDTINLHADAGYDADFEKNELRRFVWNIGPSFALSVVTLDFGFGGSKFNEGIKFTPDQAPIFDDQGNRTGSIQVRGDNVLGSNFVDFLGGIKVRVLESGVLTGAVNVPVNSEGFRPTAVGTIGFEYYL